MLCGNVNRSGFRDYVFVLLFYKRSSDCFDGEVHTQAVTLVKAGCRRIRC